MPAPSAAPSIRSGDVGDDELALAVADDSELGVEGGERIGADLGLGVGDGVEEGRFAGIGKADQADVGEQLQPKPHPGLLARPAVAVLARRAVGRALVAGIAAAAVAALQEDLALADPGEVGEDMLLVLGEDLGADRDLDEEIAAAGAGAVAGPSRPCRAGPGNAGCSGSRSGC